MKSQIKINLDDQNVQRSRPVKTRSDSQTKQHYQNASIGEIVDPYKRLYFNFNQKWNRKLSILLDLKSTSTKSYTKTLDQ